MKYEKAIFESLSRGAFICGDSHNDATRRMYFDIEDNYEEYSDYFARIGLLLEQGDGYFYFSRSENKVTMTDKLTRFGHWIDILDFVKSWEPTFGPGFSFTKAGITAKLNSDIDLQTKAAMLYDRQMSYSETMGRLLKEMSDVGYIELSNDAVEEYTVLNAIAYLEEITDLIITDEDLKEDEAAE